MDPKFHPAIAAIKAGDLERFRTLLRGSGPCFVRTPPWRLPARRRAIPPGFDYAGTGLHYAAMEDHQPLVDYLLAHGADPRIKDKKVNATPAGWADHGGHPEIKEFLEGTEKSAEHVGGI